MYRYAIVGGLLVGGLMPGTAFAGGVEVINYNLNDSASFNSATTNGYSYYTGPITLITTNVSINVYCADLNHVIYPGTTYEYSWELLTENGRGETILQPLSNEIGQIAGIGLKAFTGGNDVEAAAAQAAIWSLEYGTTTTFAEPTGAIATDYAALVSAHYPNTGGYAEALIPIAIPSWPDNAGATQQMVVGIPESTTWVMMLLGFAGLGFAGCRASRRRAALAV